MADMRTQLEARRGHRRPRRRRRRHATRPTAGRGRARAWRTSARHGPELVQDCIQLHGGIGVTSDHDLHLFLRRAALDANRLRHRPADFARRLGALVVADEEAAA